MADRSVAHGVALVGLVPRAERAVPVCARAGAAAARLRGRARHAPHARTDARSLYNIMKSDRNKSLLESVSIGYTFEICSSDVG